MFHTLRYYIPAVVWAILITLVCLLPVSDFSNNTVFFPSGLDKIAHLVFFFVLTILLFSGKIQQQESYTYRPLTIFKIVLITSFIGLSIEGMQRYVFTYRSGDILDFIADMLGVFMAIFGYIFLHRSR
ncbi:MAG: VanZ family protein [Sphingobacteriaceae bacterium]